MRRIVVGLVGAFVLSIGASAASAQTLKLLSVAGFVTRTNAHGKTIPLSSSAKPQPGWQLFNYGTDYVGTQASHGAMPVGYDAFYCVIVKFPFGDCMGSISYQGSYATILVAHDNLSKPTTHYKVTYGNGVFKGTKTVTSGNVKGFPQDEEFTLSYQPGVA